MKAIIAAGLLAASLCPAKAMNGACFQIETFAVAAQKDLNAAAGFDHLAHGKYDSDGAPMTEARRAELTKGSQELIQDAGVWQAKLAQAQVRCGDWQ